MRLTVLFIVLCFSSFASGQTPKPATKPVSTKFEYPLDLAKLGIRLPTIDDHNFQQKLRDPDTIFYKLPMAWQHYIPPSRVEHKNLTLGTISYSRTEIQWGIYYASYLKEFNANMDFPWEGTVGLNSLIKDGDEGKTIETINFLILPKDDKGEVQPVILIYEIPTKWIFPIGTIVGEIIMVRYDERWWVQEIRCREKSDDSRDWEPIVYRPCKNRTELMQLLHLPADYQPAKKHMFFRNPEEDEVFKMEGLVERLPHIAPDLVKKILLMPFKDVTYESWSEVSTAPCSDEDFSILPKNYSFGLIAPDSHNCASCHKQTQISVRNLIPKEPAVQNNFEKVGSIRGSDTVFTWHPWEKSTISSTPISFDKVNTVLRSYDLDHKVVKIWEPRRPFSVDGKVYKLTEFVQSSLASYELPPEVFLHSNKDAAIPEK